MADALERFHARQCGDMRIAREAESGTRVVAAVEPIEQSSNNGTACVPRVQLHERSRIGDPESLHFSGLELRETACVGSSILGSGFRCEKLHQSLESRFH